MKHILTLPRLLIFLSSLPFTAEVEANEHEAIRVATYNVSFHRSRAGQLAEDLAKGSKQAEDIARVIRFVRPDVLLLNEFDYDSQGRALTLFQSQYLESKRLQNSQPIRYSHSYFAAVNTGVPSGLDLNNNSSTTDPNDAYGFGRYPGQYGMVVLSRFPIDRKQARTFQKFLWRDMPSANWPHFPDGRHYYSDAARDKFRLSSKSHWDVPIHTPDGVFHFLVAHPTPPAFDGIEDRNGRRNHDEIRFWNDYLTLGSRGYMYDDGGAKGGLPFGRPFIIAGDLNADPHDGNGFQNPISLLLKNPLVNSSSTPTSQGGKADANKQGRANLDQRGPPSQDTADFNDSSVGNLRADYVLPSRQFKILRANVFWPKPDERNYSWIKGTDHRLVFVDLQRVKAFDAVKTPQGIELREQGQPVLFYQRQKKSDANGKFTRANYVHPLYDLDGRIVTEDFPKDHPHHRGVFWAWHQVWVGDTKLGDPWTCQRFEWDVQETDVQIGEDRIEMIATVFWKSPDYLQSGVMTAVVEEQTRIRVWKRSRTARNIDFRIRLKPLVPGVKIGGSEDTKGYGGFSPRIRMPNDLLFTSALGRVVPQRDAITTGNWVDLTATFSGPVPSGITISDHPANPGYPQPWILRQKNSMQNTAFPGRHPTPLAESLTLQYRLTLHQGRRSIREMSVWAEEFGKQ